MNSNGPNDPNFFRHEYSKARRNAKSLRVPSSLRVFVAKNLLRLVPTVSLCVSVSPEYFVENKIKHFNQNQRNDDKLKHMTVAVLKQIFE